MKDQGYDPISYTALKVLQQRARNCTIPMCKEMAKAAGIDWASAWPRRILRRLIGGKANSGMYLQLRHDAMSHALSNYPEYAVLELAAGFGTRGVLEFSGREAYIETDLQNLLHRKEKAVKTLRAGVFPSNYHFHPANVTDKHEMSVLGKFVGSLNLKKPIAIIHEGLLMYFSHREQEIVRENISQLMRGHKPGAIWLTSDFSERNIDQSFLQQLANLKLRGHVKRRLNYFVDNDAVESFLRAGGLEYVWLPNSADSTDARAYAYAEFFRIHKVTIQPNPLT